MNPRQRYLETLLFGKPDRIPLAPGVPRESTLAAWHTQGLPPDQPYLDALSNILGVPREAFDSTASLPECFRMIPTFEEKVLEERDGHYIVQDWMGAITEISSEYDYTYLRHAKDFVTRKWHKFPVSGPQDWEQMAWRYNPRDAARFPAELVPTAEAAQTAGTATRISINGPFWQLREWVGMENLCMLMVEQPVFVRQMIAFWQGFVLKTLEGLLQRVQVDAIQISEDMAYKAHSMISPRMAREFLLPCYQSWDSLRRSYGCAILDMDSDGYIAELIPIWIEGGFNCCNPIEIAAGNDPVVFRQQFGRNIAYHGGIDKRLIAIGGAALREEMLRIAPALFVEGGYIPGCDHGVPPDISWPNFVEYTRILAELCGWL